MREYSNDREGVLEHIKDFLSPYIEVLTVEEVARYYEIVRVSAFGDITLEEVAKTYGFDAVHQHIHDMENGAYA